MSNKLSKEEMLQALEEGKTVAHKYFTPDEWMKFEDGYIVFEDGNRCELEEFWRWRMEEFWNEDWRIIE